MPWREGCTGSSTSTVTFLVMPEPVNQRGICDIRMSHLHADLIIHFPEKHLFADVIIKRNISVRTFSQIITVAPYLTVFINPVKQQPYLFPGTPSGSENLTRYQPIPPDRYPVPLELLSKKAAPPTSHGGSVTSSQPLSSKPLYQASSFSPDEISNVHINQFLQNPYNPYANPSLFCGAKCNFFRNLSSDEQRDFPPCFAPTLPQYNKSAEENNGKESPAFIF